MSIKDVYLALDPPSFRMGEVRMRNEFRRMGEDRMLMKVEEGHV